MCIRDSTYTKAAPVRSTSITMATVTTAPPARARSAMRAALRPPLRNASSYAATGMIRASTSRSPLGVARSSCGTAIVTQVPGFDVLSAPVLFVSLGEGIDDSDTDPLTAYSRSSNATASAVAENATIRPVITRP